MDLESMRWILPSLLICLNLHAAVQDDIARAFLAGVVANNAVPVLTNATVVTPLGVAIVTATNVGSFSVAGGLIYFDLNSYTNLNVSGTLTNLAQVIIPGNTLTNTGDALRVQWAGKMPIAANTNRFTIELGSTVLLDTGLQTASNTVFTAELIVVRTGLSSQHCETIFSWGPGNGAPFLRTNSNIDLTLDNGVSRRISLNGAARRGAHQQLHVHSILWTALNL